MALAFLLLVPWSLDAEWSAKSTRPFLVNLLHTWLCTTKYLVYVLRHESNQVGILWLARTSCYIGSATRSSARGAWWNAPRAMVRTAACSYTYETNFLLSCLQNLYICTGVNTNVRRMLDGDSAYAFFFSFIECHPLFINKCSINARTSINTRALPRAIKGISNAVYQIRHPKRPRTRL